MAVEFRCSQCNKLLRTGDETTGKQAKCPECGAVTTIPEKTTSQGGSPPLPPLPDGSNPFAAGPEHFRQPDSGNPYQSPSPFAPTGSNVFRGEISPGTLDMGDIFSRTWHVFKAEWGICLGVILLVFAMTIGVNFVSGFIPLVGTVIAVLFQTWINIGQALFFLKKARGQNVAIEEIFKGGPYFGKIFLASLLVGVIVLGIALVCVLPLVLLGLTNSKEATLVLGIVGGGVAVVAIYYLMLFLSQFYYLILDRDVGIIESLTMSRDLMEGNKLTLFLTWFVSGALGCLLGIMTCGVGFLAVGAYLTLMQAIIYLIITGQPTAQQIQPEPIA